MRANTSEVIVSIVTPSFNQAHYIQDTIRSVLGQTYSPIEHLIIDGNSTDGTKAILHKYEGQIRWLSEPDNGQGDAVNKGFSLANGDIIGWINSDDFYFAPDVFSHVVGLFHANPDVVLVYGGLAYVDEEGKLLRVRIPPRFDLDKLRRLAYITNTNAFFRRNAVLHQKVNASLHFILDHEFFLRVAQMGRVVRTEAILGCFRLHPESKTSTLAEEMKDHERRLRDQMHGVNTGSVSYRIQKIYDRGIHKLQLWTSGYRLRHLWRRSPPYWCFLVGVSDGDVPKERTG